MNIFLAHREIDNLKVEKFISDLQSKFNIVLNIQSEKEHSDDWKSKVREKVENCKYVIFFIGSTFNESEPLKWEIELSERLNKKLFFIDLREGKTVLPPFLNSTLLLKTTEQLIGKIEIMEKQERDLLVDQYKIMVGSTEKVTEQRLKVNNLFFTVTTSVLSISILLGKSFGFTVLAMFGMLSLTILALLVTNFWNKLIQSYGKLNKGKFELIAEIENKLETDMFQREWTILTEKIKYEPNTKTEAKIITLFKVFIWLLFALEIGYLGYLLISKYCVC